MSVTSTFIDTRESKCKSVLKPLSVGEYCDELRKLSNDVNRDPDRASAESEAERGRIQTVDLWGRTDVSRSLDDSRWPENHFMMTPPRGEALKEIIIL